MLDGSVSVNALIVMFSEHPAAYLNIGLFIVLSFGFQIPQVSIIACNSSVV